MTTSHKDAAFEAALPEFWVWWISAPHRRKYDPDHPATLAAREAWNARGEADARVRELCASALLNPSEYTLSRRRELAKMLVPDLHPMDDGHGQPG